MGTEIKKSKKWIGSLVLFICFVAGLVTTILMIPAMLKSEFLQKDSGYILPIIIGIGGSVALGWGSHVLMKQYRTDSGNTGGLSTFYYIFTFLPYIVGFVVVGIVLGIIALIKHWLNTPSSSSSASAEDTTYTIRDEHGYQQDLKWDKYTNTYRDSRGNHYETKDGGNTFSRK